ncbi:MAG: hypothetical protein FJ405_00580 [Verrucomicrobia bacterium]|nr:hypothetical protein [Verrucomicrobiota bacterium]
MLNNNFRPPWKTLLAAISAAGGSLIAAQPTITSITPVFDDMGSGGFVDILVKGEPNTQITLQSRDDVAGGEWVNISAPTFVASFNPIAFTAPLMHSDGKTSVPHRFFRFTVNSFDVAVEDDGESVSVRTGSEMPSSVLLQTLSAKSGFGIFGTNDSGPSRILPPLSGKGRTLGDALDGAGVKLWTLGPEKDDGRFAARSLGTTTPQVKRLPDLPGDVGEGKIDQGFPGIPGLKGPGRLSVDIQPSVENDKGLKLEVPDSPEVDQLPIRGVVEKTRHLQFTFNLGVNGGLRATAALSVPGSPLSGRSFLDEDELPKNPPPGSLIYVVKSGKSRLNEPEGIYFIGAEADPFEGRAYYPPFRGSHSHVPRTKEDLRLQIPVLDGDDDLAGMKVEIYRYVKPTRLGVLTPETFLKNIQHFQLLGSAAGETLTRLVSTTGRTGFGLQGAELAGVTKAATITQLHSSGPKSKKFNMVLIAEGFADTTADQNAFNNYVQNVVMDDLLKRDVHPEILNAINIFRINTYSTESGVTRVNGSGQVTSTKDTALGYRYSGDWNRCWMEPGPGTQAAIDALVNSLIPEANVKAIILNTTGQGGCARGHHFAVTRGADWTVFGHEFGHFFGKLGDEYQCNQGDAGCGSYNGGEPDNVNLTKAVSRNQIEWNDWIPGTRPVPTAFANIADNTQDVGLFPGGTIGQGQWWNGIYRPSWRGRMNNNSPVHNPVGYTAMRDAARSRQDADFRKSVVGDFNGDGRTDLVILDDRQLSLYLAADRNPGPNDPVTGQRTRPITGVLNPVWYHTDILYNASKSKSWEFRGSDILVPADFDNDGKTDLYVINLDAWNKPYLCMLKSTGNSFTPVRRFDQDLPGWGAMKEGDKFYAGDFSGDGRVDLMVYNGTDWSMPYFLMLRSTGTSLTYVRRYDRYLPNWEMGRHEKFHVGDYNGDGRADIIAHNTQDWNQVHLLAYRSTGAQLGLTERFYGEIRINGGLYWTMRREDELFIPNFDGNNTADLAIFNGRNWTPEYLGLFAMVEGKLSFRHRYEGAIPGWDMARRDRFQVADVNGDGRQDLVVYNSKNWSTQYLGILKSNGNGTFSGSWQDDWIGSWNLGDSDSFHVADFRGNGGWDDLFVFNKNWFGMLRSYANRYHLEAIYPKWIHNHRYHAYGWW